ncbi:Tetratricopeptide TPR_2 [Winogradskyella psychrotolerans RS-3]|uniref:Tetratricopeptide TPR_2 n=1 Tax=Winogradskyella psychrotolerans RS-3 TaxID=641526 RepID=S7VWS4_9FLAO|nr:sulfotransferase [Winogradskyella psychrotolerans]EPR74705.1 Tetratricopeptide TPR_2 [Winogradskyella psychrotolerans RS-3]
MLKKKNKIFCVSFQRTGTTSVGQFFKDFGYKVASYDQKRSSKWSAKRFLGDFESIFKSKDFKNHQVFEDNPWWEQDFYRVLYHRFPNAKFILFTRDADKWFDSMVSHSKGKSLGNTFKHSSIYNRKEEYYKMFPNLDYYKTIYGNDNLLDINETHRAHYKNIYNLRNKEIVDFFNAISPNSLFAAQLEDADKWKRLGDFFNIELPNNYQVHANKSK